MGRPAKTANQAALKNIYKVCIIDGMEIDFDPAKASANFRKHGVSFDEAATCLLDPLARVREDGDAIGEQRFVLLGMSCEVRLLVVAYTLRGEVIRLISARKATRNEEKDYA
jgi:uncharacterized DUF497 family protein